MGEYNRETLKQVQQIELGIYKDFAAVCQKYNIPFFALYGTALGAVRHNGFIPWDDDMDFGMFRSDYEKFLKVAKTELSDQYDVLSMDTVDGYVLGFAKLSKKGTTFIEATDEDRRYHSGIFIDIFPFDKTMEDPEKRKKIVRKTWLWARICVLSQYKRPKLPKGVDGWKASIVYMACSIVHYGLKLFGLNQRKCYKHYLKAATSLNNSDENCYMEYSSVVMENFQITKEEIFPLQTTMFEDTEIFLPNQCNRILERNYGDYMQLPPENERKNHFPSVLKLG